MSAKECSVVICAPWRMGMTVQCEQREGHEGAHRFRADTVRVEWTGENPKLTERERHARERREQRAEERRRLMAERVERHRARYANR